MRDRLTFADTYFLDTDLVGLEFASSATVMQMINPPQQEDVGSCPWQFRRDDAAQPGAAQFLSRLHFRHLSSHISQKRPGYYLILLRNEIRHRSLREKPALIE
jgi:hypothetical protein